MDFLLFPFPDYLSNTVVLTLQKKFRSVILVFYSDYNFIKRRGKIILAFYSYYDYVTICDRKIYHFPSFYDFIYSHVQRKKTKIFHINKHFLLTRVVQV